MTPVTHCTAAHGVDAEPKPASPSDRAGSSRPTRVDLAQADAVALAPHPVDDQPDTAPVVEPGVERAKRGGLRREAQEAERGGEEGAAVSRDGHRYSIT
jgi:hypothetical protein